MTIKKCNNQTKNEIMTLMNKVIKEIIDVEEYRNHGAHYGCFPRHIQEMIDWTVISMLNIGTTHGNTVEIPDDVVDYINSYGLLDLSDELKEMEHYGKLKIER